MLKRGDRRISGTATLETSLYPGEFHRTPGAATSRFKVVESRNSVQQIGQRLADIRSLVELEAENRELRSAAIQLAQEIRSLQARS